MPTVSVIIPTYNRAEMVAEAIRSVLAQTYTDYEVIVVDDGSTDDTRRVVTSFGSPVRYVSQENKGRSVARNRGIELAAGRYIAFLDSDDLFLPTKLATQVRCLEQHPEAGLAYSSALTIDEHGNELPMIYRATLSGLIYEPLLFKAPVACPIATPTVMVRAAALAEVGGFDERMEMAEDIDLWRRIVRRWPVVGIEAPLSVVRQHSGNQVRDPAEIFRALESYLANAFRDDPSLNQAARRRGAAWVYAQYGRILIWTYWHRHEMLPFAHWRRYARAHLTRSLGYWPFQPKLLPYLAVTCIPETVFKTTISSYRGLRRALRPVKRACLRALGKPVPDASGH